MKRGHQGGRLVTRLVSVVGLGAMFCTLSLSVVWLVGISRAGSGAANFAVSESWLPVTMTVFGRGADTVSARVSFHSPTGELLGAVERSWPGQELYLDCVVLRAGSGWLVFPFLVYTDHGAVEGHRGQSLFRLYDRDGHPGLYDVTDLSGHQMRSLSALFRVARTEEWMPRFLGSLRRETVRVPEYEMGREFDLFVHASGQLEWRGQ